MKTIQKRSKPGIRPADHHSYILRLWREDLSQGTGWRASLEDPQQGERIGFTSLEQLFVYLMELSESSQSLAIKKVE